MKNYIWITYMLILSTTLGLDLQAQTLSGRVIDAITGEYILGANIVIDGENKGVSTNLYGFYSLQLPPGENDIIYSFIGYKVFSKSINMTKGLVLDIELHPTTVEIGGAEVLGTRTNNTQSADVGRIDVNIETIKSLPALFGEVDILKAIQLLPGIQSSGEGNSGFYVRGGGPDQNLILLDNATVYNASHLFGFFSVFNADAISNVDIYKGSMPARYGGRISSVLDIGLREGNMREHKLTGGIGLISSRLTAEGPLEKDRSSYIISGRRTYIDVLTKPFVDNTPAAGSGYHFYDLNMKVNHRISDKDQIFMSGYFGRDVFSYASTESNISSSIAWGNATGSVRWNHLFNDKLSLNTSAIYSNYECELSIGQEDATFGFDTGIEDWGTKTQLSYYPNSRHKIKTGLDYVFHEFRPVSYFARQGDTPYDLGSSSDTYSHETAIYLEDEFEVNEALLIHAGIRYSDFRHVGPFTRAPLDPNLETTIYGDGELIKQYSGWEPRISARLITSPKTSIKASFSENYQYVHLASLSGSSMPMDVWVPSSDIVEPQWGRQYSAGYFADLGENDEWETSVEAYYKNLENLVDYGENTLPTDNIGTNTDNNLVFGTGWSYGLEVFIKKRTGRLNGWLGYTWSKTDRLFEDLNNGVLFPAKYDRRHDLSVVLDYTINKQWKVAGVFVYATGNSITLPVQSYIIEGLITNVYGERNGYRMADYHRADISFTYTPKKEREWDSHWVFSVYNLYNRANPYFLYFDTEGSPIDGTLQVSAKQVSLFPIIPSFTWNFKF